MGMVPAASAQELPPAEQSEKKHVNMDSRLADLYEDAVSGGQAAPDSTLPLSSDSQRVQVILEMASSDAPVPQNLGIVVETTYENLVQANVPIKNLQAIAADENVLLVKLPSKPVSDVAVPLEDNSQAGFDLGYILIPAIALPAVAVLFVWSKVAKR